jgi:hypothetical protein
MIASNRCMSPSMCRVTGIMAADSEGTASAA